MPRRSSAHSLEMDWFREIRALESEFMIDRLKMAEMSLEQRNAFKRISDLENSIAKANLGLIGHMAKPFMKTLDWGDLESAGNEGLLKAIRRFDPCRGFVFNTYACTAIRNSMIRVLEEKQSQKTYSIDGDLNIRSKPQTDDVYDVSMFAKLREAMPALSDLERKVLILRYGLDESVPLTRVLIGRRLGISTERVRQIEMGAQKKLLQSFSDELAA